MTYMCIDIMIMYVSSLCEMQKFFSSLAFSSESHKNKDYQQQTFEDLKGTDCVYVFTGFRYDTLPNNLDLIASKEKRISRRFRFSGASLSWGALEKGCVSSHLETLMLKPLG